MKDEETDVPKKQNSEANKILWWLLATVTGSLLTGAWLWVSNMTSKISYVEASQTLSVERIVKLEESLKGLSKDIAKIDVKIELTNEKLDRLLEFWYRESGSNKQRGKNV